MPVMDKPMPEINEENVPTPKAKRAAKTTPQHAELQEQLPDAT